MAAREDGHEARRALTNARQNAVRWAWAEEAARVANGQGTRQWTLAEQKELMETGRVSGYEGHHMKCVSQFPEYAAAPENIQFLTEGEHFDGAHSGSYHNETNGYYNWQTGQMEPFEGAQLRSAPVMDLEERYIQPQAEAEQTEAQQQAALEEHFAGEETAGREGGMETEGGASAEGFSAEAGEGLSMEAME